MLPAELRKNALRAPGWRPIPIGWARRSPCDRELKEMPDPLRTYLRSMTAVVGGDFALIPAALMLRARCLGTLRAEISLAMADTRTGDVVYRTVAVGTRLQSRPAP